MKDETGGAGKCPFGFGSGRMPEMPEMAVTPPGPGAPAAPPAPEAEGTRQIRAVAGEVPDRLPVILDAPVPEGEDGLPTGRCLCGEVSFRLSQNAVMVFASHDAASRRRSGGVAMSVMLRASGLALNGWESLGQYPLSAREVSCFCRRCGTPVLLRYRAPDAMAGMIALSAGLFDRTGGLRLVADISHDEKPGYYAFAGERRIINAGELEAIFAGRGT